MDADIAAGSPVCLNDIIGDGIVVRRWLQENSAIRTCSIRSDSIIANDISWAAQYIHARIIYSRSLRGDIIIEHRIVTRRLNTNTHITIRPISSNYVLTHNIRIRTAKQIYSKIAIRPLSIDSVVGNSIIIRRDLQRDTIVRVSPIGLQSIIRDCAIVDRIEWYPYPIQTARICITDDAVSNRDIMPARYHNTFPSCSASIMCDCEPITVKSHIIRENLHRIRSTGQTLRQRSACRDVKRTERRFLSRVTCEARDIKDNRASIVRIFDTLRRIASSERTIVLKIDTNSRIRERKIMQSDLSRRVQERKVWTIEGVWDRIVLS